MQFDDAVKECGIADGKQSADEANANERHMRVTSPVPWRNSGAFIILISGSLMLLSFSCLLLLYD